MLISEAPIGTKIVFGTRGDDDLVWRKVTDDLDFVSERSVTRIAFDNHEPDSESRDRRRFGNNFFPHSNIFQFLNSTHGRDWFVKQHEHDTPPCDNPIAGFLSVFSDQELDLIVEREITVAVPLGSRKQFGRTYQMRCKVCLPSASELGYVAEDVFTKEGAVIPALIDFVTETFLGRVMTRTGVNDAGHIATLHSDGNWEIRPANTSARSYPMIRLRGDIVISDDADAEGLHYIKTNDEGFMEDFLSIIKL